MNPADFMIAAAIMTPNQEASEESFNVLPSDNHDTQDAVKQNFEKGSMIIFNKFFNRVEFRNSVPASEIQCPRRTIAFSRLVERLILKDIFIKTYETYLFINLSDVFPSEQAQCLLLSI